MTKKARIYLLTVLSVAGPLLWPSSLVHAQTRFEIGMSTSATMMHMNERQLKERMQDIRSTGVNWLRMDFSWAVIQPESPHIYHWGMYDKVVKAATENNMKILATLDYTPKWAADKRCLALVKSDPIKCSPRDPNEFAHFAAVTVFRYRGQSVRAWEIWNEQNLTGYWKTPQPDNALTVDPLAYARVANAAALEIRHHDHSAVVVTGGLAPMFEPRRTIGMNQADYLEQLLPRLDAHLFDAIGVHPYSWPTMPAVPAVYNAFYTVDGGKPDHNLKTIMQKSGWGNKEVWGTEFGASTVGDRITREGNKRVDHVTESSQAQIVSQGVVDWYKKKNVGPIFVHSDSDQWLRQHKNEGGFGLRRKDGSKKPAYDSFKSAAKRVKAN